MADCSNILEDQFNEFSIANFGDFQIAIPSGEIQTSYKIFSNSVFLPKRYYSSSGVLIWDQYPAFSLSSLKIENLFPKNSPFPSVKHLSVGVPVSFDIQSYKPFPRKLKSLATLSCQIDNAETTYYLIFRKIFPKSVQIVLNEGLFKLSTQVNDCLRRDIQFLRQNWSRLKQVQFYRQAFSELDIE